MLIAIQLVNIEVTVGAGNGELCSGLVKGNMLYGSWLFTQCFHALVFGVYEVNDEFTVAVSDRGA